MFINRLAVVFLCAAAAGAQAQQKPKTLKPGWNFFSVDQDIQLGKEAAAEVEAKSALVRDPELNAYINRIASKLTSTPEAGKFPYSFKVVYDKSINAFALPGGPAFVHTGLIQAADNEAQIAGVMAHEISHVALRHGTSQVMKAQGIQIIAGLGASMLGGGMLGQLAQVGAGLGANSLLLKFSRGAESDADLLGTRIMAKAGYDPIEMARFFEKLQAGESGKGGSVAQFFSDHPSPGNRVKAVTEEVRLLQSSSGDKGDVAQLKRVQQTIGAMPAPAKANANVRGGAGPEAARPSAQMQRYQSRGLTFSYPANWQVFQSKQSSEVTVASREGIVDVNGNAEIAYGAIIGQVSRRGTFDQDTQAYLNQVMQQNRGVKPSGQQPARVQVSGMSALVNLFYNNSPYPNQREVVGVVTFDNPQALLFMVFIAPETEYSQVQRIFDQMIQSVQIAR
ncbi:MAG: M48 family metalloprotease [Candidatus Solibacter usitatus]|nr:M48 family metalloprotease [Candidatus Solibacter usitatus]